MTKTADPISLPEPGGNATFAVTVQNTSVADSVTISSLTDNVYGDLDGKGARRAADAGTRCELQLLVHGAVSGNAGLAHGRHGVQPTTTATPSPTRRRDGPDHGRRRVDPGDEDGRSTSLRAGGGTDFDVKIENLSAVDSVTITSLTDDVYANLDGRALRRAADDRRVRATTARSRVRSPATPAARTRTS